MVTPMATPEPNPRFTVLIPAKDRAEYLRHTLRTCMIQDYENLEVIVSDDGSTDSTREVVEQAARKDPRIRYVSPGRNIGMRENFEFALSHAQDGYALALGADDGILPNGISGMARILRETGKELLAWSAPIFAYAGVRCPNSQLILYRGGRDRIVRSADFLRRQAVNLHYLSDVESPMFYVKGVASTRLIKQVRSRSADGRFYHCPTPDGYSGMVLAGEVEDYAYSGQPFTVFGASPSSQGMAYLASDQDAKRRSQSFYSAVSATPMHAELASQPYSPLITLMTADYLLTARDLPGWPGQFPDIDFRQLLVKSLKELGHGLYGEDRLARELAILHRVAERHGLGAFFRDQVKLARRAQRKEPFAGSGIGPGVLMLDGANYAITDIFEAAYLAFYLHRLQSRTTLATVLESLAHSLSYRLRSLRRGGPFPAEAEWLDPIPS